MATEKNDETYSLHNVSDPPFIQDEEFAASGQPQRLHRQLKNRHVAMISIGGVIGTGLFVGTANSLRNGGPAGLLLGYVAMSTVVIAVMVSLGEMVTYLPIAGGHIKLAERFANPALSFAMGWNYWFSWTIAAELSAAALLIDYWCPAPNINAVWVIICMVIVIAINMLGAGAYGEAEFYFASIKILTITGLIVLGIILDLGGGPNHEYIGFYYWKNPGAFVQYDGLSGAKGRFLGWWYALNNAAFSFIGTEIVAIAAGETKNPRRNIPKAIHRVFIRVLLFYILGAFVIGLLVGSNNRGLKLSGTASGSNCIESNSNSTGSNSTETTATSPFVIAIEAARIHSLPSIVNACFLTAACSAASSDLYTSSRALYGLVLSGNAPTFFARATKSGLPYVSVTFCALFTLVAFMAVSNNADLVFERLSNMLAVAGLMSWGGICFTYLRFYEGLKAHGIDRTTLPYYTRVQPYAAWYGLVAVLIICFFNGWSVFLNRKWDTANFVSSYLAILLFPVLLVGAWVYYRKPLVNPKDMDFVTDIAQIEADETPDIPPKNKLEAFWMWLM